MLHRVRGDKAKMRPMLHGSLARAWARRLGAAAFAGPAGKPAERLAVALGRACPYRLPGRATLALALLAGLEARGGADGLTAVLQTGQRLAVPLSAEGVSLYLTGALMGEEERRITALFRRHLRPGDAFADVGAHLGFYAHLAAHAAGPAGRVFAFEPQETLAQRLRRSIALNALDGRVRLTEAAVGDRHDATVTLYPARDPANTGSASTLPHGWVDAGGARTVPMVRLDRFLDEVAPGLRLAAVKIDVEGAEDHVIAGMAGLFPTAAPLLLVVELTGALDGAASRGAAEAGCAMLAAHGYEAWRIEADGRLRVRYDVAEAARLDTIVNIAFTAPDARGARPEIFG
jgi:FkbM family methyltransferase